jgi:hypothetical protein
MSQREVVGQDAVGQDVVGQDVVGQDPERPVAARAVYGPHVPSVEGEGEAEKSASVSVPVAVLVAVTALTPADVTTALTRLPEILYP